MVSEQKEMSLYSHKAEERGRSDSVRHLRVSGLSNLPAGQETPAGFLGQEDQLEG